MVRAVQANRRAIGRARARVGGDQPAGSDDRPVVGRVSRASALAHPGLEQRVPAARAAVVRSRWCRGAAPGARSDTGAPPLTISRASQPKHRPRGAGPQADAGDHRAFGQRDPASCRVGAGDVRRRVVIGHDVGAAVGDDGRRAAVPAQADDPHPRQATTASRSIDGRLST